MDRSRSNRLILDRFLSKSKSKSEELPHPTRDVNNYSYAIVRNIPKELRSKDLRKYFKRFIEAEKFNCFHYRHRPEIQAASSKEVASGSNTCCCIVSLQTKKDREEFIKEFHKQNWKNSTDMEIPRRCFVDRLKIHGLKEETSSNSISVDDLKEMIELKPPAVMPNGNVGTPSKFFLEQIRMCRLPTTVITKLGIQTQKRKNKFGEVPFEYEKNVDKECSPCSSSQIHCKTIGDVKDEPEDPTEKVYRIQNHADNDELSDNDDDQCEEWERHEALHEDVTEQDRTKPKKYEEEMEVTWEKGGPGLVWNTDNNYWDEKEKGTDCDWAWADDWDVDYSVYYEGKSSGDMDSRAAIEMKNDELMRSGKLEPSVFTKKIAACVQLEKKRKRTHCYQDTQDTKPSESLHVGIGGTMLTKMGWKSGSGLGKHEQGRVVPVAVYVEEDGQSSKVKSGFGYRGEKISRVVHKRHTHHIITSVFDKQVEQTQESKIVGDEKSGEILFRRSEETKMKYRD